MSIADRFRLDGRVALVTGASSGLGAHFAAVLAAEGATVAVAARRKERLDQVVESIGASGGKAYAVEMDVTDAQSVEAGLAKVASALGPLAILISNAAYFAFFR